jgi:hypothetical protein
MSSTSKQDREYTRISKSKERLAEKSTEWLLERFRFGSLTKEGSIAIREILSERGVPLPGESRARLSD